MTTPREGARKLVMVLNRAGLDRCSYDDDGAELLRTPGLWLVSDSPTDEQLQDPLIAGLDHAGLLVAGNVLVQMPYDPDSYETADEAQQRAAERKHLIFTKLCQLLGARHVHLEVVETQSDKGEARVDLTGSARGVTGKGHVEKKTAEALAASMRLDDRYVGGATDIEAAEALLEKHRLTSEPQMRSLVDARASSNQLHSRKYTVDLSRESSRQLQAAAQLKVPKFLTVGASALSASTSTLKYRATYEVAFE
ncbi:hypothetical protein E9549_15040 [Blastococcus sp. MG754426]|uniref:hypothetical protein n=1 Tax=unclassified Blastococcus TaxID=2619396 RepID=UPI001EEF79CE|nr:MULTISPECIES: hypothetical protein [unclassified Blastococcus]MCF6508710.1 hypothetical protein [Blastococcus sp. MG754426]MCF6513319.1 hypothetical protein [Blastococcus sp. MG754427]MCF6734066.1 hypothetical protein [Blastococcus sp. KM273129]